MSDYNLPGDYIPPDDLDWDATGGDLNRGPVGDPLRKLRMLIGKLRSDDGELLPPHKVAALLERIHDAIITSVPIHVEMEIEQLLSGASSYQSSVPLDYLEDYLDSLADDLGGYVDSDE